MSLPNIKILFIKKLWENIKDRKLIFGLITGHSPCGNLYRVGALAINPSYIPDVCLFQISFL